MVGDDVYIVHFFGVVLLEERAYGVNDDFVFPVGREEDGDAVQFVRFRIVGRTIEFGRNSVHQQIGYAKCQRNEQDPVDQG